MCPRLDQITSTYLSLPPLPACSLFVLLPVYTVIKNLFIDAAELLGQKANW